MFSSTHRFSRTPRFSRTHRLSNPNNMGDRYPDEYFVYTQCRSIFVADKAKLRTRKKIEDVLRQQRTKLTDLFSEYSPDAIVDVVRDLLQGRVFEDFAMATRRFPGLFQTLRSEPVQKTNSQALVVRQEPETFNYPPTFSENEAKSLDVAVRDRAGLDVDPLPRTTRDDKGNQSFSRSLQLLIFHSKRKSLKCPKTCPGPSLLAIFYPAQNS